MYGFNESMREYARNKIQNQKHYLNNHYINIGNESIPYSSFFKNAYINSNRYIAEVNNRVWSLYNYAKHRELKNIFITLTLPSEFHPYTTIKGKKVKNKNYINDEAHIPSNGTKYLTKMFEKIRHLRSVRNINKNNRVYFRVTEPHKSGVPHLHISLFVPADKVQKIASDIQNLFPAPASKVEINVNNPVSYLMKYILKTLDDLRYGDDNISDLSLWYIYHGICRFYTSRTLISLDVYRVLGGRYSLLELTRMYKDREIRVFVDPDTNQVKEILNNEGFSIYIKKEFKFNSLETPFKINQKPILKENKIKKTNHILIGDTSYFYSHNLGFIECVSPGFNFLKASDLSLLQHYNSLDPEVCNLYHYGLVQNELAMRGFENYEYQSPNDFDWDSDWDFDYVHC